MNHENFRILISQYVDNEVTSEEKESVENHLVDCPECQKYYAQLKKLTPIFKSLPGDTLSPDLEIKIQSRLKKAREAKTMETRKLFKVGVPATSLMVVLVLAALTLNVYVKRGIHGRLKSAADDIGEQYSVGDTRVRDASFFMAKSGEKKEQDKIQVAKGISTFQLAATEQYEPYYMSSSYSAPRENIKLGTESRVRAAGGYQETAYAQPMVLAEDAAAPAFTRMADEAGYSGRKDDYYYYQPPAYPSSTEQYDRVYENSFLTAIDNPLSTFSIDVDTASYSNLRRFLNNGQRVPEDAVRIEEMVNYFSYDYPEPSWGQPFSVTTEVATCPWNPSHQLAMIGLQGKRIADWAVPASNLVFLIDVSGSMDQPNKLPLLKNAFNKLVSQLSDKDRISIVVYAGAAGVVLESTSGNQKWLIQDAINRLQAGGSTAGGAGIQMAYQIARNNLINNGNNRVILATDGDFNVGVSNDGELTRMIEDYRNQGVFLTVLGFGEGNYKDSKMEKIADHGNGNYFYIDSDREAEKVLVHELGSTLFTIAKDVKLQVEFNPATVASYRLIGYENRLLAKEDFNDDTKDAGEVGAGHTVTAFYEIVPAGSLETHGNVDPLVYQKTKAVNKSSDVMSVKLRYKDPKSSTSKLIKQTVSQGDVSYAPRSENFRFASAVVEFGLVLRNSEHRAQASLRHALDQVRASSHYDPYGYRAELAGMIDQALRIYGEPYYGPPNPVYPQPMPYEDNSRPVKQQK